MRTLLATIPVLVATLALPAVAAAEPDCMDCHSDAVDAKEFEASAHRPKGEPLGNACRACHRGITVTDDGHEKPAPVECRACHKPADEKLSRSTHAEVGCGDCHDEPHAVTKLGAGDHKAEKTAICAKCHEKETAEYGRSFHGRAPGATVATCSDCHGSHDVLGRSDPHSSVYRLNLAATCAHCHTDGSRFAAEEVSLVKEYFRSAHGIAVTKGGLLVAATCEDCHGAHSITRHDEAGSMVMRARIPETCGHCHVGVLKTYMDSSHGKPFREGNVDVPVCTDCHKSHRIRSHFEPSSSVYATNVSPTCLKCHADAQYVNRYSFPGLRGETYTESYHGAASRLGDPNVANCASCHGAHDIRPSTDPKASTNAANMAATCGQCHRVDDPSRPMAMGKIHLTLAEENHWLTGVVRNVYVVLIGGTMCFFFFYIVIDFRRQLVDRRAARRAHGTAKPTSTAS
ncbi:MAG: hypothetical protein FJ087_11100 [Deltaproteobacteria bacterium]|nr:hypothetical protein [Deltaproteobacteria bacterium]